MDLVLPLVEKDLPRFRLLQKSLSSNMRDMGVMRILVPDVQVDLIRERVAAMNPSFPWQVVPETEVVPEFHLFPKLAGWDKQQLLKLASAEIVETDFYLVLDADVVATRPFGPESLIPDGHALCRVDRGDLRPHWSQDVEDLLHMKSRRTNIMHAVTPAVLARKAVFALAGHLDTCWSRLCLPIHGRTIGLLSMRLRRTIRLLSMRLRHGSKPKAPFKSWRLYLAAGQPWTEYRLYYTYLEAADLFGKFHTESDVGIYDCERSIWHAADFDTNHWDPAPNFQGAGPPYFVVLQSNTKIAPEIFAEKLEPLFDPGRWVTPGAHALE